MTENVLFILKFIISHVVRMVILFYKLYCRNKQCLCEKLFKTVCFQFLCMHFNLLRKIHVKVLI